MTQHDLETAVATVTGEELSEVQRHGFSIADPAEVNFDPEPDILPPQFIDWDDYDLERNIALIPQSDSMIRSVA